MDLFSLFATIGLRDDGFTSGIKAALNPIRSLADGVTGITSKIGSFVGAAAGIKIVETAFHAVSSSIGSAVDRYDTLNRFPKILELMGYTATDAADATSKLRDGVLGLPTSLEDIVASTQRLVAQTGDLDLSVDTTLALNNAFLASGSSAQDASRGVIQYVQQLAKGKVDIISWRTLQETMGYALTKTAESFGFAGASAQNDLYAALKNGEITFSEFNTRIIELSNATGGFAEMAKGASEGIKTSWTNMGTAITRGVAAIIASLDQGLQSLNLPGLSGMIEGYGKTIEAFLKSISSGISLLLGDAGNALKDLFAAIENQDFGMLGASLSNVLISFVSTINENLPNIIQGGAETINSFLAGLASGSQNVLNGGIQILTTLYDGIRQVIPSLLPIVSDIANAFVQAFIEQQSLIYEIGIQIITAITQGIAENIGTITSQMLSAIERLVFLFQENLPLFLNAGFTIINSIIEGIVQILPELLPVAQNAIMIILEGLSQNLPLLLQGALDIIVTIAQGITELLPQLIPAAQEIIFSIIDTLLSNLGPIIDVALQLILALVTGIVNALPEVITKIPLIIQTIVTALIDNLPLIIDVAVQIVLALANALITNALPLTMAAVEILLTLAQALLSPETLLAIGKGLIDGIVNGFQSAAGNAMTLISEWFQNVVEWVKNFLGIASPSTVFAEIGTNIILGLIGTLKELPTRMWDAIISAKDKITEWASILYNIATEKIKTLISDVIKFLSELPTKIWGAIKDAIDRIREWGMQLYNEAITRITSLIEDIRKFMSELPDKIWNAIKGAIDKVKQWATDLINTAKTEIPKFVESVVEAIKTLPDKFLEVGANMVKGIWQGIQDTTKWLYGLISGWVDDVLEWIKDLFGISSPSKKMAEIGKFTAQGFINGLLSMGDAVNKTLDDLFRFNYDSSFLSPSFAGIGGFDSDYDIGTSDGVTSARGMSIVQHIYSPTTSPYEQQTAAAAALGWELRR